MLFFLWACRWLPIPKISNIMPTNCGLDYLSVLGLKFVLVNGAPGFFYKKVKWAISLFCRFWGSEHDSITKGKHFPRYWSFVWGIHRSPVNSPHKGQWHETLMLSLTCAQINGWVNIREAGDLRHHRAPYDVNVMGVSGFVSITCFRLLDPAKCHWDR